jgi:membrane fusion protein (multidrug efflux system)
MFLFGWIVKNKVVAKTGMEDISLRSVANARDSEDGAQVLSSEDGTVPAASKALEARSREPAPPAGAREISPNIANEDEPKPKLSKRRAILATVLIAALGFGGYYANYWWTVGRYFVSTDDAYVRADLSVISAKVSGNITAVPIKDNLNVREGDILAQIDDRDYKNAVDTARSKFATQEATIERLKRQAGAQFAAIDQSKAQLLSAKASLVRASADFERAQTLAQQEFGSKQRLDQARADRDQGQAAVKASEAAQQSAEANLGVLNAQVKEAEGVRAELQSSLDKALLDLSYTAVKAPFNGVIGNKAVQVGQYVQPGTRLLSLVPLDTAYIEANYKETQLDRIRPGQAADVAVDAAGGRVFHGYVESLAPASGSQYSLLPPENATGNFTKIVQRVPVRIRVEGDAIREGVLRPGLSVVTYVNTKGVEQADKAAASGAKEAAAPAN